MDYSQFGTVDPGILKLLQEAYAKNPSLRVSAGETAAGQLWSMDPGAFQGDYYIAKDEQGNPYIYKDLERNTWGQDSAAVYGMDGKPVGISSGDSTALGLTKFILSSLAAYGGVNAADGIVNGATAASAGGGGAFGGSEAFGAGLGEGATLTGGSTLTSGTPVFGTTLADAGIGFGGMGAYAPAVAGAAAGGAGSLGSAGSTASGLSSLVNGAKDVMGSGSGLNVGGLLGAAAGALDSRDQEQKQSRAPWEPMQPYLLGLAEDGRGLYNQYKAQPFSQAQQTAYGNVGGLLDVLNQNAGGLLQGMQANATGQNQFARGQPRQLVGSAPIDGMAFTPGLLGNFGTRRW